MKKVIAFIFSILLISPLPGDLFAAKAGEKVLKRAHAIGIIAKIINCANNELGFSDWIKKHNLVWQKDFNFSNSEKIPNKVKEQLPPSYNLKLDFLNLFCKSTYSALDKDIDVISEIIDGIIRFTSLPNEAKYKAFYGVSLDWAKENKKTEEGIALFDNKTLTKDQLDKKSRLDKNEVAIILGEIFAKWLCKSTVNDLLKKNKKSKRVLNVLLLTTISGLGAWIRHRLSPEEFKQYLPEFKTVAIDAFVNNLLMELSAELLQRLFVVDPEKRNRRRTGKKIHEIALNVFSDTKKGLVY